MISRKRLSALILMLALIVPILAACGSSGGGETTAPTSAPAAGEAATSAPASGGEATAPTSAPAAGGAAMPAGATAGATGDITKLKVEDGATLRVSGWGDESEQKVNSDALARFKAIFPNVTVNYEPNPKDFQTKMKADFAGNTEPDVFYLDSSLMTAFAPNGLLLPLDDYMSQAGATTDDYLGDLVTLFQADGKTYALPKDQGALALFVNNDMAQQAGVDPASLKTWDDVTAAAKKMTSGEGAGKTYGMCTNEDIQRVGAFMLEAGNPIIDGGKATFNQDNAIQAVQWWLGFQKDGTGDRAKNQGADWCGDAFGKKKSAMVVEGGWMIPFMAQNAADITYTALPLPVPAGGQPATLVFTNGWAASARTKYPNAAAALVLFLTSAANQKPILETGFALPTVKSLVSDPYFEQNPNAKVLAEAPTYGKVADLLFGGPAKKDDVLKILKEQAMEPIYLNAQDVKPALDQAAQAVDQVLSQ